MANEKLVVEVNQGCPRGYQFTINQRILNNDCEYNITPLNLTGLTINVQIKKAPYYKLPALIEKNINESSDADTGFIENASEGRFVLQINKEDSIKLPPGEYSLLIQIIDQDTYTHLSGDGDNYAIYRVCYQ